MLSLLPSNSEPNASELKKSQTKVIFSIISIEMQVIIWRPYHNVLPGVDKINSFVLRESPLLKECFLCIMDKTPCI